MRYNKIKDDSNSTILTKVYENTGIIKGIEFE